MSMVHASAGFNRPASEHLRSEPWIIAGIARAVLPDSRIPWDGFRDDYALIRNKIEQVFTDFESYNEKILREGGFWLGNSAKAREWKTATGKANSSFMPCRTRPCGKWPRNGPGAACIR